MALAKIISSIAIRLGVDPTGVEKGIRVAEAAVRRGFKRISQQTNKMQKAFRSVRKSIIGLAAAFGVGLGIRGIVNQFKSLITTLDTLAKTSQNLGLSVNALSELRFAAERSGVPIAALDVGVQRVTRRLEEFRSTGKGVAKFALDTLGGGLAEAVRQGATFEELLPRLSAQFAKLSPQARVLSGFKLFDTEGVKLATLLLSQGADNLKRLRDESKGLTGDLTAASDKAQEIADASKNIQQAFLGVQAAIIEAFGDDLITFLKDAKDVVIDIRKQIDAIKEAVPADQGLGPTPGLSDNARRQLLETIRRNELKKYPIGPPLPPPGFGVGPTLSDTSRGTAAAGPVDPAQLQESLDLLEGLRAGFAEMGRQVTSVATATGEVLQESIGDKIEIFQSQVTTFGETFREQLEAFKVTAIDVANTILSVGSTLADAVGSIIVAAIFEAKNFGEAAERILKSLAATIIKVISKLIVEFIIFNLIGGLLNQKRASQGIGTEAGIAGAAAAAASVKTFGLIGIATAPAFAAAAIAAAVAAGASGIAAGRGVGATNKLAEGGIVTSPQLALIGEAGPEAVIPLNRGGLFPSVIQVVLDGEVLAERDMQNLPSTLDRLGV